MVVLNEMTLNEINMTSYLSCLSHFSHSHYCNKCYYLKKKKKLLYNYLNGKACLSRQFYEIKLNVMCLNVLKIVNAKTS